MADLAVGVRHVAHDRLGRVIPGVRAAVDLAEAGAGDALLLIGRPRIEIVGLSDHGIEVGDAAGRVVGIRHERRHAVVGGTHVDCLAAVAGRFAGVVLHALARLVVDRLAGLGVDAPGPGHLRHILRRLEELPIEPVERVVEAVPRIDSDQVVLSRARRP